jgi:hypothetical protein
MEIPRIEFNQPAVVILGAGVTRGASFVRDLPGTLPPLDTDFFTQAQRLSTAKPKSLVADLVRNAVKTFGTNFSLSMEGFFTQIEHLSHVFEDYRFRGRPKRNPYPGVRQQFLQVLAALLDEAVGRAPNCEYHAKLVRALSPRDTILSFNYDWLIDVSVRDHGEGKWNPRIGYGVRTYQKGVLGQGTAYWASERKPYPRRSITLLKMHGSMNWFPVPTQDAGRRLRLRQRWWHQKGNLQFEIAPPEWNKPIRSGIYQKVWRRARAALKTAKALLFIGYSLPATDLPAQALLRVDVGLKPRAAPPLDLLVLVNPDHAARSRIRAVLSGRIDSSTRVLTFDRLENFAAFLGAGGGTSAADDRGVPRPISGGKGRAL